MLEIGPGVGNITKYLLEKSKKLICIEKNRKYIPLLENRFKKNTNFKLIHDDALKTKLPQHHRIISNLPYSISEAFFQRILRLNFKSVTIIVSKTFSDTLTALKTNPNYSKLSWLSDLFYYTTVLETVPPAAYFPSPKVLTSIINLKPQPEEKQIQKILKEIIRQSDKYTKNALREALIRANVSSSKKNAKRIINNLEIDTPILNSRVSRLSLNDLKILENKLYIVIG